MNILVTIAVILIAFWLASLVMHLLGGLIHIALIVAIALIIYSLVRRRNTI